MNTILFDLDGTLLSMDMPKFEEIYFREISKVFPDDRSLVQNILHSTEAMIMNLDPISNETVFIEDFSRRSGMEPSTFMDQFMTFYKTEFDRVKEALVHDKPLVESVHLLKEKGYSVVLATNPLFPKEATFKRIKWAGFDPSEFDHITTFEDSCYLKPQIDYYREILTAIEKTPGECLMVGNDALEDLIARELGISTYLITDHLLNRHQVEIVTDHMGSYEDFREFALKLKPLR